MNDTAGASTIDASLVDLAQRLADAAGAAIRPHFRRDPHNETKHDNTPVTIADRAAETALREMLARERPRDGVIGEEFGAERADAEYVWVIDPIDGTKSFLTGRPLFVTLIACMHRGVPVIGVIDQPILHDRWLGARGQRTMFNDMPAHTSTCTQLAHARIATTGPQYLGSSGRVAFDQLAQRCRFAIYGGDGYSYGQVASGGLELVIETGLKLHDIAALVPIVTGAGGVFTDWDGRAITQSARGDVIAAANPALHRATLDVLASPQGTTRSA